MVSEVSGVPVSTTGTLVDWVAVTVGVSVSVTSNVDVAVI